MSGYCRRWQKTSPVHCLGWRQGGLGLPSHLGPLGAAMLSWILSIWHACTLCETKANVTNLSRGLPRKESVTTAVRVRLA